MTLSSGLKVFTILFFFAASSHAYAQTPNIDKYKTQLAAAAASAEPVPVLQEKADLPENKIQSIDETELEDLGPIPQTAEDSAEIEPLRLSLDKPEIIRLDRDAINVIVGSNENLRVVPDTNKTLVLIAKKPGSTYFRALDADGKVIMQRHVLIGSPSKNYIRIRRACANGAEGCKQYSVYYCPDMCHEVNVVQDASRGSPPVPAETPAGAPSGAVPGTNETETPATAEPPPGE